MAPLSTPVNFMHLPDYPTFSLLFSFENFPALPHYITKSPYFLSSVQRMFQTPQRVV